MRVLLTGGRGGIGSSIKDELISKGCSVVAPTSDELDLSSPTHVLKWIQANSDLEFDGLVLSAGANLNDKIDVKVPAGYAVQATYVDSTGLKVKVVVREANTL